MAKKKPAPAQLEYWAIPQPDGSTLLVMARPTEDGYEGRVSLVTDPSTITAQSLVDQLDDLRIDFLQEHPDAA